jgi:hypothetical protein
MLLPLLTLNILLRLKHHRLCSQAIIWKFTTHNAESPSYHYRSISPWPPPWSITSARSSRLDHPHRRLHHQHSSLTCHPSNRLPSSSSSTSDLLSFSHDSYSPCPYFLGCIGRRYEIFCSLINLDFGFLEVFPDAAQPCHYGLIVIVFSQTGKEENTTFTNETRQQEAGPRTSGL